MDEVQAVAHLAHRHQRCPAQDPSGDAGNDGPQDRHRRHHGEQCQTSAVQPPRSHVGESRHDDHREHRHRTGHRPVTRAPHTPGPRPTDQARQQRAHQQLGGAGVSSVVHDVVAIGSHRSQHGGGDTGGEHRRQDSATTTPRECRCHHERNEHVHLLLDRQGPQMLQRARCGEELVVGLTLGDEAPIGHVGHGRDRVTPDAIGFDGRAEPRRHPHHGGHDHQRRRSQSAQSSRPERPKIDPPDAFAFHQQQVDDQITRQREEQRHAQESAGQPIEPGMKNQDEDDRDAPESIEAAMTSRARALVGRGRVSRCFRHRSGSCRCSRWHPSPRGPRRCVRVDNDDR